MPEKVDGSHGFLTRRGFIRVMAAVATVAAIPACSPEQQTLGFRPGAQRVTTYITPNDEFYLVAVDPSYRPPLDMRNVAEAWSLELIDLEGNKRSVSYPELEQEATRVIPYTFECIGNSVGGQLIGNAEWHVVPLKKVLQRAGLSTEVKAVMFEGLDDFYSSVSVERATDDYAFIAIKMNGVPLPGGHGFPARVILPDLYGMKQPRWLRRISLLADPDTTSYWERRGWAGEIPVKTMSRLDPRADLNDGQDTEFTGIAFAGARGIRSVEVSLDNGDTWQPCRLETPTRPHVWSLWSYRWKKPTTGKYAMFVRAIDGDGKLQTSERSRRYPDGATGYDGMMLNVRA